MYIVFSFFLVFSLPTVAMHRAVKHTSCKSSKCQGLNKIVNRRTGPNLSTLAHQREFSEQTNNRLNRNELMVCTPPGFSADHLTEFNSLSDVEAYLTKRNDYLDSERKKIRRWTQGKFDAQLKWRQKIHNCLNFHYKLVCNSAVHDDCLAPFIREETKRILNLVKINPESVSILGNIPEAGPFATASAPPVGIENDGCFYAAGPARLRFNVARLKNKGHGFLVFLIAREIGHLLNHHSYFLEERPYSYTNNEQGAALDKLRYETDVLQDLEANVTVALLNKDVALTIHQYLLNELAKPHSAINDSTNNKMASDSEQSINDFYLWMQKIIELHEKKSRSPLSYAPEKH